MLRVWGDLRVWAPARYPQGVYPTRRPGKTGCVMRAPHRVRVWKSKRERCSRTRPVRACHRRHQPPHPTPKRGSVWLSSYRHVDYVIERR